MPRIHWEMEAIRLRMGLLSPPRLGIEPIPPLIYAFYYYSARLLNCELGEWVRTAMLIALHSFTCTNPTCQNCPSPRCPFLPQLT
jgi:hypothetical protein